MPGRFAVRLGLISVALCAVVVELPCASRQAATGGQESAVRVLLDSGRYAEAEARARALLSSLNVVETPGSARRAAATDLLVEALVRNGRASGEGRASAERALQDRQSAGTANTYDAIPSLRNLAAVRSDADRHSEAAVLLQGALAVCDRSPGNEDLLVADVLDELGTALAFSSRVTEGVAALERALALKEDRLGTSDSAVANTLERLAAAKLMLLRDANAARPLLTRAVEIRERMSSGHPALADALNLLGMQLWFDGDLENARQAHARALSIQTSTLRQGHPLIAFTMKELAIPTSDLGDLAEAKALSERALSIAEETWGPNHARIVSYVNDLGVFRLRLGDYAGARTLSDRALKIREAQVGAYSLTIPPLLTNRAALSIRLGDFAAARVDDERALEIWVRHYGPTHPYVSLVLRQMGDALRQQGFYQDALPYYEQALRISEAAVGSSHRDVAQILDALSRTLAQLGQVDRALELASRSVNILETVSPDAVPFATALEARGRLRLDAGDYASARSDYARALSIQGKSVGTANPRYAGSQAGLALALAGMGEYGPALDQALESERTALEHTRLTLRSLSERQALEYTSTRLDAASVPLSLLKSDLSSIAAATSRVWDQVIRGRAVILDEMAARRRTGAEIEREDVVPVWERVLTSRRRLANLVVRGPGARTPAQYAVTLDHARREKDEAEQALAVVSASFRAQIARADIGFDRVRQSLPPGFALVSYVLYNDVEFSAPSAKPVPGAPAKSTAIRRSYLAFVLTASADPTIVPLGDAREIDRLVQDWRNESVQGLVRSPGQATAAERALRPFGERLRRVIWDPLTAQLGTASHVLIVPDGTLSLVPLSALPVGRTEYLLEKGPVLHYLSAERDVAVPPGVSPIAKGMLALGGPAFNDGSLFAAGKTASPRGPSSTAESAGTLRGADNKCSAFSAVQFTALPAASREATDVANLWRTLGPGGRSSPASTTLLLGSDASEGTLKRLSAGHRILHVATHGFFLEDTCEGVPLGTRAIGGLTTTGKRARAKPAAVRPETAKTMENALLLSGLALAGANRRAAAGPDQEDGILTAEEVASLDLSGVEWAVLSACDTGLGEIKAGEGVFGLRRAFQVAGARTVIMSLWSVEDRSAMEWMRALYDGRLRRNLDTADAVREASLSVLAQRRARRQSTHPFFWAGFVASGDWR